VEWNSFSLGKLARIGLAKNLAKTESQRLWSKTKFREPSFVCVYAHKQQTSTDPKTQIKPKAKRATTDKN